MAEFPALPLFTDAYLADTRHLTTIQHGAYLLLLMIAWRTKDCSLPADDESLARLAGMDARTWLRHREKIMAFWKLGEDHRWRQARLLDERHFAEVRRDKNSAAGIASSLKRKERHSTTVPTKTQPEFNLPTHTLPTPTKLAGGEMQKINTFKPGGKGDFCEAWEGEILPYEWQEIAEKLSIPNDQIFKSWRKFKDKTDLPYEFSRWRAWLSKERGADLSSHPNSKPYANI